MSIAHYNAHPSHGRSALTTPFTVVIRRGLALKRPVTVLAGLLLVLFGSGSLDGLAAGEQGNRLTIPEIVTRVQPSVVTIMARGMPARPFLQPSPGSTGSGIIIDDAGYILTNNHLVTGVRRVLVGLHSGSLAPGRVVARDFLSDLALVKLERKDLVAASLGSSEEIQIGETVLAIGNPLALRGGSTVTRGIVSAKERAIVTPNGETLYNLIQTDAAINPGSSGGPLVNLAGEVVGISTAIAPSAQAIGYALAIDAVRPVVQAMIVRGSAFRPDIGFVPVTVTPSIVASFSLEPDRGVLVLHVEPNSPADRAGLKDGDVISSVDNTDIYNMGDFWHLYLEGNTEEPARLRVYGEGGQVFMSLPRTKSIRP